jgi:hypothetical protein
MFFVGDRHQLSRCCAVHRIEVPPHEQHRWCRSRNGCCSRLWRVIATGHVDAANRADSKRLCRFATLKPQNSNSSFWDPHCPLMCHRQKGLVDLEGKTRLGVRPHGEHA